MISLMFIIKVFLIFSYSSVFDKIRHRRQRFMSAGSPAAVWCVVVWSRLTYISGFIQKWWKFKKKKKKKSHELLNRATVGLYKKVLFKGSVSAMLTLVFVLRLCVIAFALLWNWTWKRGARELWKQHVKGANGSKPAARPVHVQAGVKLDGL